MSHSSCVQLHALTPARTLKNPEYWKPHRCLDTREYSTRKINPRRRNAAAQVTRELKTVKNAIHLPKNGLTTSTKKNAEEEEG